MTAYVIVDVEVTAPERYVRYKELVHSQAEGDG